MTSLINSFQDTEDYDILGNGSIITYNQKPIVIKIASDHNDPYTLYLRVKFETNKKLDYTEAIFKSDEDQLVLSLINYGTSIDQGNPKPIKVGVAGSSENSIDRDIYLNFRILGLGDDKDKVFFYTLYGVKRNKTKKIVKKTVNRKKSNE